jgi:hypothetical protein
MTEFTSWTEFLTTRQQAEVRFAREYATNFSHDTTGHQRLELIALLADMLDDGTPPEARVSKVLDVPYQSQHEDDARRYSLDCGPACVEMVCEFLNPNEDATTDAIMTWMTGGRDRATYVIELQRAAQHFYGVELEREEPAEWEDLKAWVLNGRVPVIVLGRYGAFLTRQDRGWTGGHFFVVVGFDEVEYHGEAVERVILHDPDFYRSATADLTTQGAFVPLTKAHFMAIWDTCHVNGNPDRLALVPRRE